MCINSMILQTHKLLNYLQITLIMIQMIIMKFSFKSRILNICSLNVELIIQISLTMGILFITILLKGPLKMDC